MKAVPSNSIVLCTMAALLLQTVAQPARSREPQLVGPQLSASNAEELPAPRGDDNRDVFTRSIKSIRTDISPPAGISVREELARLDNAESKIPTIELNGVPLDASRAVEHREVNWAPPATCHRPLYFEEVNLERYGYSHFGCLQPAASAAHFFANVPLLPYRMALHPSPERLYTLGHYRPGSCVPYRINQLSLRLDAAVVQGAALTYMILLIP